MCFVNCDRKLIKTLISVFCGCEFYILLMNFGLFVCFLSSCFTFRSNEKSKLIILVIHRNRIIFSCSVQSKCIDVSANVSMHTKKYHDSMRIYFTCILVYWCILNARIFGIFVTIKNVSYKCQCI